MNQGHLFPLLAVRKATILAMLAPLFVAACSSNTDGVVLTALDSSTAEPVPTEAATLPGEITTPTVKSEDTRAPPSPKPATIEATATVEPTETATPSPEPTTVTATATAEPTESAPPAEAAPQLHPPDVRTGDPALDAVIDAVLAHDVTARRELTRLTVVGCTHADGLGGPPKCREDETEGAPLEVLPILGGEGHHTRVEDLDQALSFQVEGLYAVFELADTVYDSDDFPAGEVGLLFLQSGPPFPLTVHVAGGAIVRLDYHIGDTLEGVFEQEADHIILSPP